MAGPTAPSTDGQVTQLPPDDDFLTALAQGLLPADIASAVARARDAAVRALTDLNREALQAAGTVRAVVGATIGQAPPAVVTAAKADIPKVADAVAKGKASSGSPDASAARNRLEIADPVDLASGQLVYRYVDLHLDGAGISFDLARTHRSAGRYPNGPLGASWDYSYNLWARRESPDVVVVSGGELREDRYTRVTPRAGAPDQRDYYAPPDGYHATLEEVGASFHLTRPDGVTYEFALESSDLHRISRIRDRFGNDLTFKYPSPARIEIVLNDDPLIPTRVVTLSFDDLGRLSTVSDFSGRTVQYWYDDYDDLVAVTLPGTEEFPRGRTVLYEYGSASGEARHQLCRVTDADGRLYLEVEYGTAPGYVDFGRVIRQRDDEGEWSMEYAELEHPDQPEADDPVRYAVMARPNGSSVEHWMNRAGNLLAKRERALDENGRPRTYLWQFRYNRDGQVVARLTPEAATGGVGDGMLVQHQYGREAYMLNVFRAPSDPLTADIAPTASERRAFANELTQVRRANVAAAGWPPIFSPTVVFPGDIAVTSTYDPDFQQIRTRSDPRSPGRLTVHEYRANDGALQKIIYPAVTRPDGTVLPPAEELFEHSDRGRLLTVTDAEGHRTVHEHFPRGTLVNGVSIEGHLMTTTIGANEPNASVTRYEVNARGLTTRVIDGRGNSTELRRDAADRLRETRRELQRVAMPPVVYTTRFHHTREGKLKREERELKDDAGGPLAEGVEVSTRTYNDSGLLVRDAVGGAKPTTWLAARHRYNGQGQRTRSISPLGSVTQFRYDARGVHVATIHGAGTADASIERFRYDGDGRRRATVDGRGVVTRHDYDSFGRIVRTVHVADRPIGAPDSRPLRAREGHTRCYTYDQMDNVVLERAFEFTGPGQYALLSRTATACDERGRATKITRDLFAAPVAGSLSDFDVVAGPPPGSLPVETWLFVDGNNRVVERRDGVVTAGLQASAGSVTTRAFDAAGRTTNETAWLPGNPRLPIVRVDTTYDPTGNIVRMDETRFQHDAQGILIGAQVITHQGEFDSLGRRVLERDGAGNVARSRFDSRDRMTEHTDPVGNATQFEHDGYGRLTHVRRRVNQTDELVTSFAHDADSRTVAVSRGDSINPALMVTEYEYDALDRRTAVVLAPNTPASRRLSDAYDAAGNLVARVHPNLLREVRMYDQLNQLTRVEYDRAAVDPMFPVLGTVREELTHDSLGRLLGASNDFSSVRVTVDSFGRPIEETSLCSGLTLRLRRTFDVRGNRVETILPSGRRFHYMTDPGNRLVAIDDIARGQPNVGQAGAGARRTVTRSFSGRTQVRDSFANGWSTDHRFDAAGRCVAVQHRDANGGDRLALIQLWDGANNRRQDWQVGTEALTATAAYAYDGANRLRESGTNQRPAPKPDAFAPPAAPVPNPAGQAAIDTAFADPAVAERGYAYDPGSNRVSEQISGQPPTVTAFDALDQIVGRNYDLDGRPASWNNRTLRYDQAGRLAEVQDPSGSPPTFTARYDALGRRIEINESGVTARFVYDGLSDVAEYRNGTLVAEHVLAPVDGERLLLLTSSHDHVVHRDILGSTRLVTDETGQVRARFEFDPFGRVLAAVEGPPCRHRFMGREWDAAIRAYHFRARHYEPDTGRFLQRDPADASPGLSSYHAFAASPLVYVDPMGTRAGHVGAVPAPIVYDDPSALGIGVQMTAEFAANVVTLGTYGVVKNIATMTPDSMGPTMGDFYRKDPYDMDMQVMHGGGSASENGREALFRQADRIAARGARASRHLGFWTGGLAAIVGSIVGGLSMAASLGTRSTPSPMPPGPPRPPFGRPPGAPQGLREFIYRPAGGGEYADIQYVTPATRSGAPFWGTWEDYPHVMAFNPAGRPPGPQPYALVGPRLYSYHAVQRALPRFFAEPVPGHPELSQGRGVPPGAVDLVLRHGTPQLQANGNTAFGTGVERVIVSPEGRIITVGEIGHPAP